MNYVQLGKNFISTEMLLLTQPVVYLPFKTCTFVEKYKVGAMLHVQFPESDLFTLATNIVEFAPSSLKFVFTLKGKCFNWKQLLLEYTNSTARYCKTNNKYIICMQMCLNTL